MLDAEPYENIWKQKRRFISSISNNTSTKHIISARQKRSKSIHKESLKRNVEKKWNAIQTNKLSEITDNMYMLPNTVR